MVDVSVAAITKLVGKVLDDLYELGKDLFASHLAKLKREAVRRKLAKRASSCEEVKTIWQLDKEVRISDFYYPSRIKFGPGITKEVGSLQDFPRKGNFLIEGTIGQGKSIFLRFLCAEELRGKGTDRLPVFVELRLVDVARGLKGALLTTLDEYGFEVNEDLWHFYAASGKFVFLLDAFDELAAEAVPGVIAELDHLSAKYPDLQIIVTSRPDSELHHNRHFRIFRLAPLSQSDHKLFLRKLLLNDGDVRQLLQAIEASPARVASLLTTPLMLTLVAVVYRAERAIPPELPEFFEMLFATLFSRHDRTKSGFIRRRYSALSEREIQILFEAFCFMTRHHGMSTSLTDQEIERALRDASKYSGIACDPDAFYKDITKIACLMQREGLKTNFVHKSIQEFFTASFIRRANDAFAKRFYESQRAANREWIQENSFLLQIDPYRYAKHFFIPEIAYVEQCFAIDFTAGLPKATAPLLDKITGDVVLRVSVDEDDDYLDAQLELRIPPQAGPVARRIFYRLMTTCYMNVDGADGEDKARILRLLQKESDTEYVGDAREFLEKSGLISELAEGVDSLLDTLKRRYDHLRAIIKLEESKSNIFDGIEGPVATS